MNGSGLTRRAFLQRSALAAGTLALSTPIIGAAAGPSTGPDHIGVLVDLTRCIGCRACERACNERNELPQPTQTTAWDGPPHALRYDQWTVVNLIGSGHDEAAPVKRQCMHCLSPACASVCPVGALQQLPTGAVVYRQERCIGCRYCVLACPFDVPKFQWDAGTTPVVGKCQFCAQQAFFTGPACVGACPTGSLKFGRREELLTEARARLQARPDRYVDHIYGEHEVGGTSWLYLAGRPFASLGFRQGLPTIPLPSLTRMALHVIPAVATTLAVVLSLLSFVRRPTPHAVETAADA